ncbi:acyltransferase [Ruminococcus sp. OA3]|uniref:acyltransferase n=1 Tax=Ruminococcus sp. OA3 TaxID=2914164 RepID=UPI001F069CF6|nr:acyltransferase [Ruminococcus sp. OA3]MCH1982911.1 acyltransferase [Ruminococcus sp. OA3]
MNWTRIKLTIGLFLRGGATARGEYLKNKNLFLSVGEHFYYQPRVVPLYSKLIKFGNNIMIGSNVRFITHDAIHYIFSNINNEQFMEYIGCIEIGDNVFIGNGATILPNVKIGNNVIIGANSVVNKDLPSGGIYAGMPAKKCGKFDELYNRRRGNKYTYVKVNQNISKEEIEKAWKIFENNYRNANI